MFQTQLKLSSIAVSFLLLFSLITFHAAAQAVKQTTESSSVEQTQSAPGQPDKIPQPGELGSPFSADHFWKNIAFELGGGYTPVVQKGAGYFNKGFNVTAGVIDHLSPHWTMMAEFHFFGLSGNFGNSNTTFVLDAVTVYDFLPRASTSPYVVGGVGYYQLGPITSCGTGGCALNVQNGAKAAGYNGGLGIRHRLYADRRMELFAEGRYHYIASGSSGYGQLSLLPISAGIRW